MPTTTTDVRSCVYDPPNHRTIAAPTTRPAKATGAVAMAWEGHNQDEMDWSFRILLYRLQASQKSCARSRTQCPRLTNSRIIFVFTKSVPLVAGIDLIEPDR